MKIAQIAPLYESVPPNYYGGTERVVSCLTEELVRQGHDVIRAINLLEFVGYALISPGGGAGGRGGGGLGFGFGG